MKTLNSVSPGAERSRLTSAGRQRADRLGLSQKKLRHMARRARAHREV